MILEREMVPAKRMASGEHFPSLKRLSGTLASGSVRGEIFPEERVSREIPLSPAKMISSGLWVGTTVPICSWTGQDSSSWVLGVKR